MDTYSGCINFPVWLIADTPPSRWKDRLASPLDPRHPARHSIWTSVENYLQRRCYRRHKLRFDTSRLYIRNALVDTEAKPRANELRWGAGVPEGVKSLRGDIDHHRPRLVLTLGAFSFEFVRRTKNHEAHQPYGHWSTTRLGYEFRHRLSNWTGADCNTLPLLHASIARGRFLEAHAYYVGDQDPDGNYFQHVGEQLADLLLERFVGADVWEKTESYSV